MNENKTIFVDDYHIDEIVPSIPRKIWFNLSFKIYQEYRYFLENTCPQMDVMLCIDMGESKTKFSIPTFLDDHIIGNSDVPPSIYLFNKQNTNIIDTLKRMYFITEFNYRRYDKCLFIKKNTMIIFLLLFLFPIL